MHGHMNIKGMRGFVVIKEILLEALNTYSIQTVMPSCLYQYTQQGM